MVDVWTLSPSLKTRPCGCCHGWGGGKDHTSTFLPRIHTHRLDPSSPSTVMLNENGYILVSRDGSPGRSMTPRNVVRDRLIWMEGNTRNWELCLRFNHRSLNRKEKSLFAPFLFRSPFLLKSEKRPYGPSFLRLSWVVGWGTSCRRRGLTPSRSTDYTISNVNVSTILNIFFKLYPRQYPT